MVRRHHSLILLIALFASSAVSADELLSTSDSTAVAPLVPLMDTLSDSPIYMASATSEDEQTQRLQRSEAELTARVEALERIIREGKVSYATQETLPAGTDKAVEDCKQVDIITKPTFTPTGRLFFDAVNFDDDNDTSAFFNTDRDNEFGVRRARLGGRGNIYENLAWQVEVEFRGTNSAISFKNMFLEQQNIPGIGRIRAGHFKEPISLEENDDDYVTMFMEESPATTAFSPARNFGVMIWNTTDACQTATWYTGLFRADSPDSPTNTSLWRSDNNDWSWTSRLAWLPYYDEPSNGRYLTHLGGSYSFRHIGGLTPTATYNQNVAYSTLNGQAEFSDRSFVGTQGPIGFGAEANSDEWNQLNAEYLTIWGPWTVQSEYFQVLMNSGENYQGGYAYLAYMLTGENRGYNKETKLVDRVQPFEPFFWVDTCNGASCGRGAWEVAVGYSWVDLEDGHDTVVNAPATSADRRRGFDNAFVVGMNWYQNYWSMFRVNYSHEVVNYVTAGVPTADANIVGMRWEIIW